MPPLFRFRSDQHPVMEMEVRTESLDGGGLSLEVRQSRKLAGVDGVCVPVQVIISFSIISEGQYTPLTSSRCRTESGSRRCCRAPPGSCIASTPVLLFGELTRVLLGGAHVSSHSVTPASRHCQCAQIGRAHV